MKITIRIYDNEDRSNNSGTKPELSGFATIGMLEYWNVGIMGSKRHSAKGRGQRVKNSYAMLYALCLFLFHVRGKISGLDKFP